MAIASRPHGQRPPAAWRIRYREARAHALLVASILWCGFAIVTFAAPGARNLVDHLKGEDFVQIYAIAHAAFEGPYPTVRAHEDFHARQVALVPASAPDYYLPVYPPTAALVFRPFVLLSYLPALAVWSAVTIGGYAAIVYAVWRRVALSNDTGFLIRAAAAFPPFFLLVLYGQTSIIPFLAFALSWLAARAGHAVWAGIALSLLTVKPQFAPLVCAALVAGGQGRMLLGLCLGVGVQLAAVGGSMGLQAFVAYADTMRSLPAVEPLLEPEPWRMHSLRSLTRLLPQPAGDMIWILASLLIAAVVLRIWRRPASLDLRYGLTVIATVLINPHLFAYDAVVLFLSFMWVGGWLASTDDIFTPSYWQAVYLYSVLILFPTAAVIGLQGSVIVLTWLFHRLVHRLEVRHVG